MRFDCPTVDATPPSRVFWIVWNPDSEQPPRVRFGKEHLAISVAEKLARENPNEEFYVLRAVTKSTVARVVTERLDA